MNYGQNKKAKLGWCLLAYLLNTIGAETLTIRGSAKSSYGKLFEKLVLGFLLHILGLNLFHPRKLKIWIKYSGFLPVVSEEKAMPH